ncbi:MAG TPA: Rieske (2Fe-2S) protein [Solirubrobacteraceae bacterium]|nr:Rieske (2Fe-2S) protein [Solirubrobacteraceae bacterium]
MSPDPRPPEKEIGRLLGLIVAVRTAWQVLRGHRPSPARPESSPAAIDPSERSVPANRRIETLVAALLAAAALCGFGFTVIYIVLETDTQLLGLAMGACLALLAAAAIVAGKLLVPQETSVEPRDQLLDEEKVQDLVKVIHSGGDGISRRGLLAGAGGLAGAAVVTAVATPLASLGPPAHSLHASPWRRGVGLVDDQNRPYAASDIEIGSFYTALPEGESWETFGASLLVVRLPTEMIHLPATRRDWTPEGIMAFSKICPHAGCAISLYRYPTYAPTSAEPAFTCPCHYSTFTPADGGQVVFGPAGRALPQLPVMIDGDGRLRAAGVFDEDIGPSWWGVRRT